jgi:hypothetical protein
MVFGGGGVGGAGAARAPFGPKLVGFGPRRLTCALVNL